MTPFRFVEKNICKLGPTRGTVPRLPLERINKHGCVQIPSALAKEPKYSLTAQYSATGSGRESYAWAIIYIPTTYPLQISRAWIQQLMMMTDVSTLGYGRE
jgi:hypothetical protein